MTKDTRAEILVVAGVAALLVFLWFRNRQTAGNGFTTDLSGLPAVSSGSTNSGVPLGLTMPTGLTPGQIFGPLESPAFNVGGVQYNLASPSACGCGGTANGVTYGGATDLAAALLNEGYDMPFVAPGEAY